MVGKSDIDGIESSRQQDMYILRSLAQKGRLRTLSFGSQTSQLWLNPKEIRQRNVRVRCIVSAPLLAYVYNNSWRGLLALLILWVRQCEGLRTGISKCRLPRLFFSLSLIGWIWEDYRSVKKFMRNKSLINSQSIFRFTSRLSIKKISYLLINS